MAAGPGCAGGRTNHPDRQQAWAGEIRGKAVAGMPGGRCILGPFGEGGDLRPHGLKISERGGKHAQKRSVVAVALKPRDRKHGRIGGGKRCLDPREQG